MRHVRIFMILAVLVATAFLGSCGEAERPYPVLTHPMGERVMLGHINYQVFETQWLTHLGDGPDQRIPKQRFFLVRLAAVNSAGAEVIVRNFSIEDDSGNSYPELSEGEGVPQYIGYLRSVPATGSVAGNALFDAPPRHYKMKIQDETGEKTAYIDIPLAFISETPDVPALGDREKKK